MPNTRRSLLVALALAPSVAVAQPLKWADSARVAIETAAIAGDVAQLQNARAMVERALTQFPADPLLLHYDGYALYREASSLVGQQKMAQAAPLLKQAAAALEQSAKKRPMAETSALLAMVYGLEIGADPSQGMSREHLTNAIAFFEKDHPAPGMPAWGRAEAHVWLSQALLRAGDTTRAVAELRQALAIEPNYFWPKTVLLPQHTKDTK
jgi:tetratricopeptide (TPR) repeat protein